jgi:hypothetical protein
VERLQLSTGRYVSQWLKVHGLSPRANYTNRATATCRRSDCQLLRIKCATWSAWRIPTAVLSSQWYSTFFCSRTCRRNFSWILYPQLHWCIFQSLNLTLIIRCLSRNNVFASILHIPKHVFESRGHAVRRWLRHYAASRKFAGASPVEVIVFFKFI